MNSCELQLDWARREEGGRRRGPEANSRHLNFNLPSRGTKKQGPFPRVSAPDAAEGRKGGAKGRRPWGSLGVW